MNSTSTMMNSTDRLIDTLRREVRDPVTLRELEARLGRSPGGRDALEECLQSLVASGEAIRLDERHYAAPGTDIRLTLEKHDIPDDHDPSAIAAAKRLGKAVRKSDLKGRTDFRTLPTVTIDGETARDFDDAITLEPLSGGRVRLGVHIADVAHYVVEGSALDRDARDRATSVYFPDRAVHMLPPPLATGLCSLRPGVDRLVQSCLMDVDRRGKVVRYEMHDGVIRSDERMTYADVDAILSDPAAPQRRRYRKLIPFFEQLAELTARLTKRRRARGALDIDVPVATFQRDDEGRVAAIVADQRTTANRIIEECMLLANETVASHLERMRMPALYRVHEPPDPEKVERLDVFARSLGQSLGAPPDQVTPAHFQRLLDRMRGEPAERAVGLLTLRTMQRARYDATNLGHFGLASGSYTHFTSPIRRYPDLLVHRALRESRAGGLTATERSERLAALAELAKQTSELERRAEEAEREVVRWQQSRFMADKVGDTFVGYVIGVTSFGLFVELVDPFVDGMVHISTMADDYYRFDENRHLWRGEASGRVYRLGDRVEVQLVRVDRDRRQSELALTEILESVSRRRDGRTPRPRRRRLDRPPADRRPRTRRRPGVGRR